MTTYDKNGERIAPYAQDKTGGTSKINPLNYKGDVLTQTWIDSRVLASLTVWMEKVGYRPRTLSDVARKPLEVLLEFLVESGDAEMVESTADARSLLQNKFRVSLNRGSRNSRADDVRGGKNILHNTVLSGRRQELGERMSQGQVFNDAQRPIMPGARSDNSAIVNKLVMDYERLRTDGAKTQEILDEEYIRQQTQVDDEQIRALNDLESQLKFMKDNGITVPDEEANED